MGVANVVQATDGWTHHVEEDKMRKTGEFATAEEMAELHFIINTPVMMIFEPRPNIQKVCHAMALKHGLPEIQGYYGITYSGEFVEEGLI